MNYLAIILFLFAAISASAQDAITVPQLTQAERGSIVRIPISGTITQSGTSQVTLTFPADVINILSIEGGDVFAYTCPVLLMYGVSFLDGAVGQVTAECANVVATPNGPLFEVVAEVLRGPGTSGPLQAIKLLINGSESTTATFERGIVEATGERLVPTHTEGFTGNYPNPFDVVSTFVFQAAKPGTASLIIRSVQGRIVMDLGSIAVTAGENHYDFTPDAWELAQGSYLMQLVTENGAYHHAFMVVK